ncbi:MAG: Intracellular proteinase inhibitor [Actinomycetota bacterium]|nr:Intracellular proteinase inhibitor [Actinomycetota bacterium]
MPDQDLLPRGHTMMRAPAPPAGLGDVLMRAGRRRRRQQAGAVATGAAACLAVLAFTMAGGGAVDSLRETPATPTGHGVAPAQTPRVPGPEAAVPAGVDGAVGPVAGPALDGTGAQRAAAQSRQDKARAAAAAQHNSPGGEVGPPHTVVPYDASRGCGANGPTVVMGWCSYYDGATTGTAGQRVDLAEALCRVPGQGTGTLESDNGQQADFSVFTKDNYSMWTWSKGHRFSKQRTTIQVPAGSCVRWAVVWSVRDDAGRPLARGAYQLDAASSMGPPGDTVVDANAQFVTFTVL